MAHRVCPIWVGYLLLSPIRRLLENPQKMLGPFVSPGMTILEPGSAMGYFTLPLARMVGPEGKVMAVDIQEQMLAKLRHRAAKAGLAERIETRLASPESLNLAGLEEQIDLAVVIHVAHEVPDQGRFFKEIYAALKPQGRLLVIEPKGHVKPAEFDISLDMASLLGFSLDSTVQLNRGNAATLVKA
jgi:ubiquinone/menaquinone biosynthesis C-methylase UbiE